MYIYFVIMKELIQLNLVYENTKYNVVPILFTTNLAVLCILYNFHLKHQLGINK